MSGEKDKITAYYSKARELVKQNNPKEARRYIVAILNYALGTYNRASTILQKARAAAFLDKWIAVSRELYDKGITDYVLNCFGLPLKQEQTSAKTVKPIYNKASVKNQADIEPIAHSGDVDIDGLIEATAIQQEWCAEVFEKNKTAVVEITVCGGGTTSTGTGFIISKNGYLLTNDHVVFDENTQAYYPKAKMSFAGEKKSYKLNILFSDKKSDVALCSFQPEEVGKFSVIKRIPDYSQVVQGIECIVIGNSLGEGLSPLKGNVRYTKNESGNLVHTAPSNPGDSGGPVLNRNGECIGINKCKTISINHVSADSFINATPMDKIDELLNKWSKNNDIRI